ncbi:Anthranilate synthase component 1 [Candidatus Xiphinematobacter sp. Idaho Grape]|nr:Anthranilate synthase component 1 [Candidatus Xiphinematobacter sp. Idaho Grape]
MLQLFPGKEEFLASASGGDLPPVVPIWTELTADHETPISAYRKLFGEEVLFLLEFAEGHNLAGRYSIIALGAHATFSAEGNRVQVTQGGSCTTLLDVRDPLSEVEKFMIQHRSPAQEDLSPFWGGAIGYLAYDTVRWFEPTIPLPSNDELGLPDMFFLVPKTVLIFDHHLHRLKVVVSALTGKSPAGQVFDVAVKRIRSVVGQLSQPVQFIPLSPANVSSSTLPRSNTSRERYHSMVERAKAWIHSGDVFQVVLSQRFECSYSGDPLEVYRALRFINPSPYLFCLRFPGGFSLVGSSPEVHVRVRKGKVEIRPIAGTRRSGQSREEAAVLEKDLLSDAKECAEHLMLVDLARSDMGRIAVFGSIQVTDFMTTEHYSHVMHIVSHVEGRLIGGSSAFDVVRATFPAGTVSGSPKVRAMQIINELEISKRCTYAGIVGRFGYDGSLNSCITLRTTLLKGGKAYVQAGGGIVADSTSEGEYQETVNKAMASFRALEIAKAVPT